MRTWIRNIVDHLITKIHLELASTCMLEHPIYPWQENYTIGMHKENTASRCWQENTEAASIYTKQAQSACMHVCLSWACPPFSKEIE